MPSVSVGLKHGCSLVLQYSILQRAPVPSMPLHQEGERSADKAPSPAALMWRMQACILWQAFFP